MSVCVCVSVRVYLSVCVDVCVSVRVYLSVCCMFRNYRDLGVFSRIMACFEGIMTSVPDTHQLACSQVQCAAIKIAGINVLVVGHIYIFSNNYS